MIWFDQLMLAGGFAVAIVAAYSAGADSVRRSLKQLQAMDFDMGMEIARISPDLPPEEAHRQVIDIAERYRAKEIELRRHCQPRSPNT